MITFPKLSKKTNKQKWLGREMMRLLKFGSKSLILVSLSLLSSNLFEEHCRFSPIENGNSQSKSQSQLLPNEWYWAPKSYAQEAKRLQSIRNHYNEIPKNGNSFLEWANPHTHYIWGSHYKSSTNLEINHLFPTSNQQTGIHFLHVCITSTCQYKTFTIFQSVSLSVKSRARLWFGFFLEH